MKAEMARAIAPMEAPTLAAPLEGPEEEAAGVEAVGEAAPVPFEEPVGAAAEPVELTEPVGAADETSVASAEPEGAGAADEASVVTAAVGSVVPVVASLPHILWAMPTYCEMLPALSGFFSLMQVKQLSVAVRSSA
jgi:hypothetical protein